MTNDIISKAIEDTIYMIKARNENKHNSSSYELQQVYNFLMTAHVWYGNYLSKMKEE